MRPQVFLGSNELSAEKEIFSRRKCGTNEFSIMRFEYRFEDEKPALENRFSENFRSHRVVRYPFQKVRNEFECKLNFHY